MGNCCGKSSSDDNFAGPGRTLDSAPARPQNPSASIPAQVRQGQARTVGGNATSNPDDPREAARRAAEQRNQGSKASGPGLAKNLENQKKQTMNQALQAASRENRQAREADAARQVANYD